MCRIPTRPDAAPLLLHSRGLLRVRQKPTTVPVGMSIPNHRHYLYWGPPNRAQRITTNPSHHGSRRTNQVILHLLQHRIHVISGQALGTHQTLQHAKHAPQATLLHTVEKQESYIEV